ncbi:MAG: chemotaxis protein CheB [Methanomicrobiales archaeon]|jgi:two-component system chemotaxis response regulator CheB|nr:chemotaxis protein CheB [Methanomicrobiales archaeon]
MNILIIGSSTGGPRVVFELFNGLPTIPVAIIIVQHMPESTTQRFTKRLSQLTSMNVIIPKGGENLKQGTVYVAPGDSHLVLKNNETILLEKTEKVNFVRPSIDVTMMSLTREPRHSYYGIILSGMGQDGAQGISHLKRLGGHVIVQNPGTCIIKSMPESAMRLTKVDQVLSPEEIKKFIWSIGKS